MEPQRINLTSEHPVSHHAYRTSHKEEAEIKEQIQNLLKAVLIKESCFSYSALVTLVLKRGRKKKHSCVLTFVNFIQ